GGGAEGGGVGAGGASHRGGRPGPWGGGGGAPASSSFPATDGGSAGERDSRARASSRGGTAGGWRLGSGSRAVAREHPASGAARRRAFDLSARGGGSTVAQPRGASADAARWCRSPPPPARG